MHITTTKEKKSMLKPIMSFVTGLLLGLPLTTFAMAPMSDAQLSDVTGQALLISDYIAPNSLSGAGGAGSTTDFGFYRMGLDATVETNVNINKLQLGCGGYNNNIKVGCDIDLDYVSMLGLGNGSAQPNQQDALGATNKNMFAGAPATSGFIMNRPYVTIAVANPNNPQLREVVGFKFGAQSVSGYMGIGRVYQNNQRNLETGEMCVGTNGQSLGCHSGLNSLSGYMFVKVSGAVPVQGSVMGGLANIIDPATNAGLDNGSNACFGATNLGSNCTVGGTQPITAEISGTRIQSLSVVLPTETHAIVRIAGLFNMTMDLSLVTNLKQNLRFIHGFATENTGDFFLSFQRQQVKWPKYDKSGYAVVANAGWWMNIPSVSTENLSGATLQVNESGIPQTLNTENLELKSVPPINCYGGYRYC